MAHGLLDEICINKEKTFEKFGTYLLKHTNVSWNIHYIGSVKAFLDENHQIRIFDGSWFEKFRNKIRA